MTDHQFTDDEVIKALEICAKSKCWGDCEDMGCPAATKHGCYFYLRTAEDYEGVVQDELLKDALALINRQKAEIEKLNDLYVAGLESLRLASEANKDMQAEIDRLRSQVNRLKQYDEERDIRLHARLTANARAEAIKEFAERLRPKLSYYDWIYVDNLVKEMTEDLK